MAAIRPEDLGNWFDAHGAALVLYARQWLERAQAEDVVQDVFLRLMAQRSRPASPKAWLFRCVRNAAITQLRSRSRREAREARQSAQVCPWFEPEADDWIDAQTAQAVLAMLPDEQREVVVLRIWGEMSLREIAEVLGLPLSTVFSRYQAALGAIRQRMDNCGERKSENVRR